MTTTYTLAQRSKALRARIEALQPRAANIAPQSIPFLTEAAKQLALAEAEFQRERDRRRQIREEAERKIHRGEPP